MHKITHSGMTEWSTANGAVKSSRFVSNLIPLMPLSGLVIGFQCEFNESNFSKDLLQLYGDASFFSSKTVTKRMSEFTAGRICADHCLKHLGLRKRTVGMSPDRSPVWPIGVIGSISHTTNRAACIASTSNEITAVGLDIENILSEKIAGEIYQQIVLDRELDIFNSTPATQISPATSLTILFSAKECIYKALYPIIKYYFGFHTVECIKLENTTLHFEIKKHLNKSFYPGCILTVDFILHENSVQTMLIYP